MNSDLITSILAAPLDLGWTIDRLAERLLEEIAMSDAPDQEFQLDPSTDRQSRRLIRPLLACLATKSAAENGFENNVFGGDLLFKRPGLDGLIEIRGGYRNTQSEMFVSLTRMSVGTETSGSLQRNNMSGDLAAGGVMTALTDVGGGPGSVPA